MKLEFDVDEAEFPPRLRNAFTRLARDPVLDGFLSSTEALRAGKVSTVVHRLLCGYFSDYEVNGFLGIYPMHLLSTEQAATLLTGMPQGRLLDIGAGAGDITMQLRPLFVDVVTTELSFFMRRRLRRRGFACERRDVARAGLPEGPFSVVALLNVLDRCLDPERLLAQCCSGLAPEAQLLVSVPLPYDPHAYRGGTTVAPARPLPIRGATWERQACSLVLDVIEPLGLRLKRFARLPYLSAGDSRHPVYALDALVASFARPSPGQLPLREPPPSTL